MPAAERSLAAMPRARRFLRAAALVAVVAVAALPLGACRKPRYDTSTPAAALDAMAQMVKDGRPELLAGMVEIAARDVTFQDGVTEASAIADVKDKAGDMLAQLWRVSGKIRARYPREVEKELAKGGTWASRGGFGDVFTGVVSDPFGWLDANRSRLEAEDLGDGTATFSLDGTPVLGGTLSMAETPAGWRVAVPVELIRSSGYFPDTREEWSVVAYLMLAVENALRDFERELDRGDFPSLAAAGERAGRMVAESAVAQAVIFALMQRNDPGKPPEPGTPEGFTIKAGGAEIPVGSSGDVNRDLGNAGDLMRRRAE
jgi:hypothetical protein